MIPTLRTILLLSIGCLPLLIVKSWWTAFAVFVCYNTFIIALIIVDLKKSCTPALLSITRIAPEKLSIGAKNKIIIKVKNRSEKSVKVDLYEEIPLYFECPNNHLSFELKPHEIKESCYYLTPKKRGEYELSSIYYNFKTVMQTIEFAGKLPLISTLKVYPDISSIEKFNYKDKKSYVMSSGIISSRRKGLGTEFESLRDYIKGDDYRKIYWKATARKGKLIVKEFESERNQNIVFALDTSRYMESKIKELTRLDHAINTALLVAHAAIKKHDFVNLVSFDETVTTHILKARSKNDFFKLVEALYLLKTQGVEPVYQNFAKYTLKKFPKRSLIIIFTDIVNQKSAIELIKSCKTIRTHHIPFVLCFSSSKIVNYTKTKADKIDKIFKQALASDIILDRHQTLYYIEKFHGLTLDLPEDQMSQAAINQYMKIKLKARL